MLFLKHRYVAKEGKQVQPGARTTVVPFELGKAQTVVKHHPARSFMLMFMEKLGTILDVIK
jgi:hypothetical protein